MYTTGRRALPFRLVNCRDSRHYDPTVQRHHLLPCQLLRHRGVAHMLDTLGVERIGLHDFRRNGLLLPSREEAVDRMRLPLHRGPHRAYNDMVIERVARIEHTWARRRLADERVACEEALMRLGLLQNALRRRLLSVATPYRLNSSDPLGAGLDFTHLDAMAELLWAATG